MSRLRPPASNTKPTEERELSIFKPGEAEQSSKASKVGSLYCDGLSGKAARVCKRFCQTQNCPATDVPSERCLNLEVKFATLTGELPPCALALAQTRVDDPYLMEIMEETDEHIRLQMMPGLQSIFTAERIVFELRDYSYAYDFSEPPVPVSSKKARELSAYWLDNAYPALAEVLIGSGSSGQLRKSNLFPSGQRRLDNPGCDYVNDLYCCAKHDECFDKYGCTAKSWLGLEGLDCAACNVDALSCMATLKPSTSPAKSANPSSSSKPSSNPSEFHVGILENQSSAVESSVGQNTSYESPASSKSSKSSEVTNSGLTIAGNSPDFTVISCSDTQVVAEGPAAFSATAGELLVSYGDETSNVCDNCAPLFRKITGIVENADGTITFETSFATFGEIWDPSLYTEEAVSAEIEPSIVCEDSLPSGRERSLQVLEASIAGYDSRELQSTCAATYQVTDSDGNCIYTNCHVGEDGNPVDCFACGATCDNGCGASNSIFVFDGDLYVFDFGPACCHHGELLQRIPTQLSIFIVCV